MKYSILLVSLLLSFSLLPSCKDKDTTPEPAPVVNSNYSQLKTGNYWIYQVFNIDSAGNTTTAGYSDSAYIKKDTLIHNQTYYEVHHTYPIHWLETLRDSLHYLVDSNGKILFSSQDFTSTLSSEYVFDSDGDTMAYVTCKMTDKNLATQVPAGAFITSNARQTWNLSPKYANNGAVKYHDNRYAQNIGLVEQTIGDLISAPITIVKRLVRYHLLP